MLAPETGEYEFLVRTENATRLWVNDNDRALDRRRGQVGQRHRVSRVDLPSRGPSLSFTAGADLVPRRTRHRSRSSGNSHGALGKWFPRGTSPRARSRKRLSLQAPFPPDDRSVGYERGTSVSKAWDQATTDAAIEVAGYVVSHLKEFAGAGDDAPDRRAKLREFCSAIRRAGIPSAAHRRPEVVLHRPPVQGGSQPGSRRQAGRAPGSQIAPVPLP